jgi:hypothetical protein
MELANSRVIKDEQTTQNHARAAIDAYTANSDERIISGPNPVSQRRHLDVDAVLARSVRKVVSE